MYDKYCKSLQQALWVDSSKRRKDAENLTLLNTNVETFIK